MILIDFSIVKASGRIQWSQEQASYIADQYVNNRVSIAELSKKFMCDRDAIKNVLRKNNIHIRTLAELHPKDDSYFEVIDSHAKAYWLGLLYADGTVSSQPGSYRIGLGMTDLEHIEKFKLAVSAPYNKITVTTFEDMPNASNYYSVCIYSEKMRDDLIKLGCVPNKTYKPITIPEIPNEYIYDFIRGFFDGDGCLRYDSRYNCYGLSFVSASYPFLSQLKDVLGVSRLKISDPSPNNMAGRFEIKKQQDLCRILPAMYDTSTEDTRLNRKYQKYLNFLDWISMKKGGLAA